MITFASSPVGWDPASGGTYIPIDHFTTHIKGGPRVNQTSVAILGMSSPAMDYKNVQAALEVMPTEKEWHIFQFIDVFLEEMFMYLIGATPGSTTDPGQDAQHAITELIEHATWEPDNDLTTATTWEVHSKITWDVTYPGMRTISTIGSE